LNPQCSMIQWRQNPLAVYRSHSGFNFFYKEKSHLVKFWYQTPKNQPMHINT